jgi:hypothetical protein
MAVLVLAEHNNAALNDATAKTVAAAQAFGGDIDVLVAGHNAKAAADAAAKLAGVRKVIHVEGEAFSHALAEAVEALVVPMMAGYDAFFAPATTTGKNVAPRIAAKLDVMQISEITKVVDTSTFERPIYAGNAIMTVKSSDAKKVVTVRGTAFQAAAATGSASVESAAAPAGPFKATFVSEETAEVGSSRTRLGQARRLRRPRPRLGRTVQPVHPAARRQARRGRRRLARRGRRRLCPERLPGRPDRQGRRSGALHRHRHLGRHPAPRRHEGLEDHRRHQQGRGSPDLPDRRLRASSATFSRSCLNCTSKL